MSEFDDETVNREARRILRRLCDDGASLCVGQGMPQAVVLREADDPKQTVLTATVARAIVEAFILKDWVACYKAGRIFRYHITEPGRSALRRLMDGEPRHD